MDIRDLINMVTVGDEPTKKQAKLMESRLAEHTERMTGEHITWIDEGERVIAKLKSHDSAAYTRLGQKYEEMVELGKRIKALEEEFKGEAREMVNDLFAASDAVSTRVVETVSFTFTLSKDPIPTKTVQYAKVIDVLAKELTPELNVRLEEIKEQFTRAVQKAPSLRVNRLKEGRLDESLIERLVDMFGRFRKFVQSWGKKYDSRLEKLKAEVGLNESVERFADVDPEYKELMTESINTYRGSFETRIANPIDPDDSMSDDELDAWEEMVTVTIDYTMDTTTHAATRETPAEGPELLAFDVTDVHLGTDYTHMLSNALEEFVVDKIYDDYYNS